MFKYVLKRIGLAFFTTFIILSLTFVLTMMLPIEKPAGQQQQQTAYFDEQVRLGYVVKSSGKQLEEYGEPIYQVSDRGKTVYYYKEKIIKQYFKWIENIVTKWEWGVSNKVEPNVKATVIIGERLLVSLRLNILSVIFSVPIGIALGIWAALKKNSMTDYVISTIVMIAISIPSFVLITFLLLIFGYTLKWIPTVWPNPTDPEMRKILGYLLPVFCLSFGSICGYCRFVRAELCEVMESEYLLLARTKGLTRKQAIVRHALKNAMVPIFPSILAEFIGVLGGSMILEKLYGIPGIGGLFVEALQGKDYNILFVDMAIFTTLSLLFGVLLDISYGFIDPRIRMGAKK